MLSADVAMVGDAAVALEALKLEGEVEVACTKFSHGKKGF